MKNRDLELTSVKIHKYLKGSFKADNARTGFTLQKLVNRAIHLFLTDEDFRDKMMSHTNLATSGSI